MQGRGPGELLSIRLDLAGSDLRGISPLQARRRDCSKIEFTLQTIKTCAGLESTGARAVELDADGAGGRREERCALLQGAMQIVHESK